MQNPPTHQNRQIFTVSELTANIKALLEDNFAFIWIAGEISNFRAPTSGHFYFTLKDEHSQIRAVMFRGQNKNLTFRPEDGLRVTGIGRVNVYEPRGTYQIILEYMEPKGIGELQIAYEQLKKRLALEGLFEENHKKPLPFLPKKIGVITSPTGSVVHDILRVIDRRFPDVHILIVPVAVQGKNADLSIAKAIELLNARKDVDVAILARGGGSLEDLAAFNSEIVARAIFNAHIPIVSAVGHETDYTISDFTADLRAPTPSVAAELLLPQKKDLVRRLNELYRAFKGAAYRHIELRRTLLAEKSARLGDPKRKIQDFQLRVDDYMQRSVRAIMSQYKAGREKLSWWTDRLHANSPQIQADKLNDKLEQYNYNILKLYDNYINLKRSSLNTLTARLNDLSPTAILARGYSITRTIPEAAVVHDPNTVSIGQNLEIMLSKGAITAEVKKIGN